MIISTDRWKGKGVYLIRAEQYSRSMANAFEKKDWDSCVGNAIHCAISAQDAFCIHIKAQRYKGTDHREAAEFFMGIFQTEEHKKAAQRLFDQFLQKEFLSSASKEVLHRYTSSQPYNQ